MKTITIVTPANIEIEYRLAGAGARLAAFLIDLAVQVLLIVAVAITLLWFFGRLVLDSNALGVLVGITMVSVFLIWFGYFIFCEITMRGQSLGKRVFGLRVIRDNGQPLGAFQSVVRGVIRGSVDMMYVGLFVILFSKKHKRLGDMAAGTIVICERYTEPYKAVLSSEELPWPTFLPDRVLMDADERILAEEWLRRRHEMTDGGVAVGDKLIEYFRERDLQC